MSDLLSIGASGVRAYQTALNVVGENIANVGVAGYTRRTTTMTEVAAGVGAVEKQVAGNGVAMTGIGRSTDAYASAAVRSAGADLARTEASATWLERIEQSLTGNQLTTRVTGFFTSATALAAEPTSTALRTGMLSAAQSAAIAFKATGQSFDQMATDLDTAGKQAADTLNSLSTSLLRVNDGLGRTTPNTAAAAQLADQRDSILEQMSAITDIGVSMDQLGRATVTSGGAALVARDVASTVNYARTGANVALTVVGAGATSSVITPNGGALAGIVEAAERIASARSTLDQVATDFVTQINAAQATGEDLTGTAGTDIFAASATNPTDFSVIPTDGSKIAASLPGKGVRNGGNLTAFEEARFDGAFEAKLTAAVNDNATAYKQKSVIADAQTAIRNGASTALTSKTGVNIDSEAIDLMRFQQAYQASSRVIQAARDTFQSILEIR
ncbi:flagellar hook-associated protein FlgK [Sphingomonas sp. KR1UV-12]|uniref:Flagellar hook-associated protein 1 n=1 Tax=Sphingomonas aurea TaxID=3063994 RepID=A0ABT9EMJ5_9SPHN|nr:flagellar hook-associated protein FlgK [Sphingomonas sp. KR1UV-12]MDP1028184.1 flagellar hook-associated protein FlgK [Sphingomonas sp. KR1UV-12]